MGNVLTDGQISMLNNSQPANQVVGLGKAVDDALAGAVFIGKKFYLDPVNGNDGNDGLFPESAKKTLTAAYSLLTTNKNDILYIIGGASALNLTSAFTWDKSYTHLIGMGSEVRFGGRIRIGHAGTDAIGNLFTVSGSGCIFHNIHFQHGTSTGSATNLKCVTVSGLRNLFSNCHFEASLDSVASGSSYAWRAVELSSAAQANTFRSCTFGSWTTVWASAAGRLLYFAGDNADTYVEDCFFVANTSSTSMKLVDFAGAISGGYSVVTFDNCKFVATNSAPGVVFGKQTNGWIFMSGCTAANCTAWGATNANFIQANGAASAAGTGIGAAQS